jgi:hypothetical protein
MPFDSGDGSCFANAGVYKPAEARCDQIAPEESFRQAQEEDWEWRKASLQNRVNLWGKLKADVVGRGSDTDEHHWYGESEDYLAATSDTDLLVTPLHKKQI